MANVKIINAQDRKQNHALLDNIFKLRHESFKERLGWQVNSQNGREVDNFDELDVSYIALTNQQEDLVGCWRALPSKGDYMLRSVFPELLRGEDVPEGNDIWEISRFTVNKAKNKGADNVVSNATALMVGSFYKFAKQNGIRSYVLVTTVACERILRLLGVTMRRMGDGKAMQVGIERSVALWIEVDENLNIQIN